MGAKRGTYAKTRARRQAIARAALALVEERGHRNFTTMDVAQRAEVSEALIFYHFPNREALLIAALHEFDDEEIPRADHDGVLATIRRNAEQGVRRTNIVRLYTEMSGQSVDPAHPAHDYFRERWMRSRIGIEADIVRLQRTGAIAAGVDATHAARVLLAAWEGLQLSWLIEESFDIGVELDRLIEELLGIRSLSS